MQSVALTMLNQAIDRGNVVLEDSLFNGFELNMLQLLVSTDFTVTTLLSIYILVYPNVDKLIKSLLVPSILFFKTANNMMGSCNLK